MDEASRVKHRAWRARVQCTHVLAEHIGGGVDDGGGVHRHLRGLHLQRGQRLDVVRRRAFHCDGRRRGGHHKRCAFHILCMYHPKPPRPTDHGPERIKVEETKRKVASAAPPLRVPFRVSNSGDSTTSNPRSEPTPTTAMSRRGDWVYENNGG